MLQETGESVEGKVAGCAESGENSAQESFLFGDVDCVAGVVQGRSVNINGVLADRGVDGAKADADSELTHMKLIMHVPEQIGKDAGIGKQPLEFVAEGDDETGDHAGLIFVVERCDKFRKGQLDLGALGTRQFP